MSVIEESSEFIEPVDIVQLIAEEKEWPHSRQNEGHIVIQQEDECGEYFKHAGYNAGGMFFSCTRSFDPKGFAELEVLRLINLVNHRLEFGSFIQDFDSNVLLYKLPCDYDDDRPLDRENIEGILQRMGELFTQYFPSFLAVAGEVSSNLATERNGITAISPGMDATEAFDMAGYEQYGHA